MAWYYPTSQTPAPSYRAAHSCDKVGNCLYIFGGWNGKRALNDLHILDIDKMTWFSNQTESNGIKPAARNNHTTAVVGDKIFFHGGHDGSQWLDDLFILNTQHSTWTKPNIASSCAPSARACHTLSRVGRKLYMFGGYDGLKCFNDVDILDLDTMTWIQPIVHGSIPMARNAHTMTVLGKKLYLFGGHSGNKHLKDLYIFDTQTLTWIQPEIKGTPPKGLRGHTANLIGNKIYLFGGYDGRGRSNDLYILNTDTNTWSHPVESENTPTGRQRHTACVIGTKQLFIFGGFDGNKWLNDICILDIWKLEEHEITNQAVNSLIQNMRRLINNQSFADVKFNVQGKHIYAHKAILSQQCQHFRAMFKNGMKQASQSEIDIKDWTYDSYVLMLEYLYTGSIKNFNSNVALDLLGLADAYTLQGLKYLCENTLIHNVDIENVCELLIDAHRFSANELKQYCMKYIIKNFTQVNQTQGFENLQHFPSLLIQVTRAVFASNIYKDG